MQALLPILSTLEHFQWLLQWFNPIDLQLKSTQLCELTALVTSHNRHYHCQFYFFWEYIGPPVSVENIESELQDSSFDKRFSVSLRLTNSEYKDGNLSYNSRNLSLRSCTKSEACTLTEIYQSYCTAEDFVHLRGLN